MMQQDGHATDESVLISLRTHGPQTMDQLTQTVTDLTWPQIFGSVDRLSRAGRVILTPMGREYEVALSVRIETSHCM